MKAPNRPDTKISVTTWERNKTSEKVIVAYWYEVGDYTMYERQDLLNTQWAMSGKTKWPVMFKVLLEMPAGDSEDTESDILSMAQFAREWLGTIQPELDQRLSEKCVGCGQDADHHGMARNWRIGSD